MNKGELIEQVAKECGMGTADAERVVARVFGTIAIAIKAGDKVALPGFGTFSVAERAAREGRNPASSAEFVGSSLKIAPEPEPRRR